MGRRFQATPGFRLRDLLLGLVLFSHLLIAFGFPLPAPDRKSHATSRPFPCQNHPCGCLTADLCWQGDCCCMTLEEKLAWADANGVEPPEHVRPLVASRSAHPAPAKKKSCCSEAAPAPEPTLATASTCCGVEKPSLPSCPHCAASSRSDCCEKTRAPTGVRWLAGLFARKCRGEGPAGLFQFDPSTLDLTFVVLTEPGRTGSVALRPERSTSTVHRPPTPPPRRS
jgi:hypothetical protein